MNFKDLVIISDGTKSRIIIDGEDKSHGCTSLIFVHDEIVGEKRSPKLYVNYSSAEATQPNN